MAVDVMKDMRMVSNMISEGDNESDMGVEAHGELEILLNKLL